MIKKLSSGCLLLLLLASSVLAATTWKNQVSVIDQFRLRDVHFTSQSTGVAVGDNGYILRTTNRGITWNEIAGSTDANIYAVHMVTADYGYAAGENTLDSTGVVYKTTNGGTSWALLAADPDDVSLLDVFFTSTLEGYVSTIIAPGPGKVGVYRTTDGGVTWNDRGTGLAGTIFYGLHFISTTTGWACGAGGSVCKTTDSGANWAAQTSGTTTDLQDIFFIDANTGWAVGGGVVLKTTDGGANWVPDNYIPLGDQYRFQKVHFIDSTTGWLSGYFNTAGSGFIWSTTNGGTSWTTQHSTSYKVYSLYAQDQYNVWGVGGNSRYIGKMVVDPTITNFNFGGKTSRYVGWTGVLTIEGTNFQTSGGSSEYTGMVASSGVWTSTSITGLVTLTATGTHTVTVYNADGGIGSGTFTVNPLPAITSADPANTVQGNTYNIALNGSGFQAAMAASGVSFSLAGVTANSLTYVNQYQIIVNVSVAAGAATGACNVTVTNPDGGVGTGLGVFNVGANVPPPVVSGCTPNVGDQGETLNVVISGANFHQPKAVGDVIFGNGDITVNSVTYNSAFSLTANITILPAALTKYRTVTVINSDDSGVGSKSDAFRVRDPNAVNPTVTSVKRDYIYTGTLEAVIINGTGFTFDPATGQGSLVSFDPPNYLTLCNIDYIGTTAMLVCLEASSSAQLGARDVVITNPDGGQVTVLGGLTIKAAQANGTINNKRVLFYPNPWNYNATPNVTMQFEWTGAAGEVDLSVVSSGGQVLKSFTRSVVPGNNNLTFDATTTTGGHLSAGIVLVPIKRGGTTYAIGKLMVKPWQ